MKSNSQSPTKWLDRAVTFQQRGNLRQAADAYRRYLRHHPGDAGILHTLGGLYYQLQDDQQAGVYLEKALGMAPENPDYLNDLAAFLLTKGEYQNAILHLTKLVEQSPGNPQGHYNLGIALHGAERLAEAITTFEEAIRLQPDYAEAWFNLGVTCQELGQFEQAEAAYRKAIRITPFLAQIHLKLGEVLSKQYREDAALESFQKAYDLDRNNPAVIARLAESLHDTGRTDQAIRLLQEALKNQPQQLSLMSLQGRLLHTAGHIAEAEDIYRQAMALKQDAAQVCFGFSRIRKFSREDKEIIHQMEALLENKNLNESERQSICFALGKIHDDCEEYEKAFRYYTDANAIQHKRKRYDRQAHERFIDNAISVFTKEFFDKFSGLGTEVGKPIFIVGMPRSGTTLTEQIIASHPEVTGGGELLYFSSISKGLPFMLGSGVPYPLCCRSLERQQAELIIWNYLALLDRHSATASFVTDKMPGNYKYLGLIRMLFPGAPIIHCRRDPLDVCLSIYFQNFSKAHDYAHDLMDIGHYYLQYARLMAHWRRVLPGPFMECRYETLINNQETCSQSLIAFCGLAWDDGCLEFYQQKRDVRTASNWQVRQPIYTRSVKRWKNYEKYLAPLVQLFGKATDEL